MTFEGGTIDSWMTSFDESGLNPDGIANVCIRMDSRFHMIPVNEVVEFQTL